VSDLAVIYSNGSRLPFRSESARLEVESSLLVHRGPSRRRDLCHLTDSIKDRPPTEFGCGQRAYAKNRHARTRVQTVGAHSLVQPAESRRNDLLGHLFENLTKERR
jgi:hypothetical protein